MNGGQQTDIKNKIKTRIHLQQIKVDGQSLPEWEREKASVIHSGRNEIIDPDCRTVGLICMEYSFGGLVRFSSLVHAQKITFYVEYYKELHS